MSNEKSTEAKPMVRVENLVKHFPKRGGVFNQKARRWAWLAKAAAGSQLSASV